MDLTRIDKAVDQLGVVACYELSGKPDKAEACFCEGMEKQKYGKMADSKHKFTVCVFDHYSAYVFFWALRQYLGIKAEDK